MPGVEAKKSESAADIAQRIMALRNQKGVDLAPERESKVMAGETPVTTRILHKAEKDETAEGKWQQKVAARTGWRRE